MIRNVSVTSYTQFQITIYFTEDYNFSLLLYNYVDVFLILLAYDARVFQSREA